MSFGYGTGEFEVTTERLGCYRPEEHIDNPKDYAENIDARQYDRRLRGPVDERRELSIDPDTGMKNYIASERLGIDTSAALVRNLFGRAIDLGRKYNRSKKDEDLYEALRLIGTGCHCLEDYSAHSNYVELALIEMGERDVFPHVGRNTAIRLRGARSEVWPIVTGTFGGTDFLHSVCGEFQDKATQSEIKDLEDALNDAENSDGSVLRDLLSKIPSGLFGGKDEAGKVNELQQNAQAHQMQNTRISPRQPEEWARYLQDVQKQIYPIIQWHDEVMQGLTQTIEKLPILPDLIERVQDEINKFVFSLLAPYVVPIIRQISNELETGSSEIIGTSKAQQHIVFNDDHSSDPTHSMLSKDHFSNILNEPAGRVASATVKWVVPQLIEAWDNERADIPRTLDRIINGVLHHPALRDQGGEASEGRRVMFGVVEKWWSEKDSREKEGLRRQLSRRGVQAGDNHKEGVHDHGHGSYRPKGQRIGIAGVTGGSGGSGGSYPITDAMSAVEGLISGGQGGQSRPSQGGHSGRQGGNQQADDFGKKAGEAAGGGIFGGIVSGIASAVGADMLGGGLDDKKDVYKKESHGRDGSHTQTFTQVGQSGDRYGQAQYSRTEQSQGGRSEEYTRYEQRPSGGVVHHEERDQRGNYREQTQTFSSSRRDDDDNDRRPHGAVSGAYGSSRRDDDDDHRSSGRRQEHGSSGYGSSRRDDDDNRGSSYGRTQEHTSLGGYSSGRRDDNSSYGSGRQEHGSSNTGAYGSSRRDDDDNRGSSGGYGSSRRNDNDSYGSGGQQYGSSGGYGQQQQQQSSYGSSGGYGQQTSHGRSEGYGQQSSYGQRDNDDDDDDNRRSHGSRNEGGSYGRDQGQDQGGYGSGGGYGNNDSGYGGRRY